MLLPFSVSCTSRAKRRMACGRSWRHRAAPQPSLAARESEQMHRFDRSSRSTPSACLPARAKPAQEGQQEPLRRLHPLRLVGVDGRAALLRVGGWRARARNRYWTDRRACRPLRASRRRAGFRVGARGRLSCWRALRNRFRETCGSTGEHVVLHAPCARGARAVHDRSASIPLIMIERDVSSPRRGRIRSRPA